MSTVTKFGDWTKAGIVLKQLSTNITPKFSAQLEEDGNLLLKTITDHIDNQDLKWKPLSSSTIRLKNGDETIYVETGFLRENLKVRKVRSSRNGVTYFIGADAWTKHKPSGLKFSDLMIYLEYGTAKMPARPLIRPSFKEVESTIKRHWNSCLKNLIIDGGVK